MGVEGTAHLRSELGTSVPDIAVAPIFFFAGLQEANSDRVSRSSCWIITVGYTIYRLVETRKPFRLW